MATRRSLAQITVEEIADRAGVSRRTFFNYYGGMDAVLVEATREPMAHVAEAFLARPLGEDPLSAIISSLDDHLPRDLLQWCVVLGQPQAQESEIHRQVWHLHTQWLGGSFDSAWARVLMGSSSPVWLAPSCRSLTQPPSRGSSDAAVAWIRNRRRSSARSWRRRWAMPATAGQTPPQGLLSHTLCLVAHLVWPQRSADTL